MNEGKEASLTSMMIEDNRELRFAGDDLARCASEVCIEYDGVHLRRAISRWHQAVANEGGRGDIYRKEPGEIPYDGARLIRERMDEDQAYAESWRDNLVEMMVAAGVSRREAERRAAIFIFGAFGFPMNETRDEDPAPGRADIPPDKASPVGLHGYGLDEDSESMLRPATFGQSPEDYRNVFGAGEPSDEASDETSGEASRDPYDMEVRMVIVLKKTKKLFGGTREVPLGMAVEQHIDGEWRCVPTITK